MPDGLDQLPPRKVLVTVILVYPAVLPDGLDRLPPRKVLVTVILTTLTGADVCNRA